MRTPSQCLDLLATLRETKKKKKREYTHYDSDGEYEEDGTADSPSPFVESLIDWLKRVLRPLSSLVLRPKGAVRADEEREAMAVTDPPLPFLIGATNHQHAKDHSSKLCSLR